MDNNGDYYYGDGYDYDDDDKDGDGEEFSGDPFSMWIRDQFGVDEVCIGIEIVAPVALVAAAILIVGLVVAVYFLKKKCSPAPDPMKLAQPPPFGLGAQPSGMMGAGGPPFLPGTQSQTMFPPADQLSGQGGGAYGGFGQPPPQQDLYGQHYGQSYGGPSAHALPPPPGGRPPPGGMLPPGHILPPGGMPPQGPSPHQGSFPSLPGQMNPSPYGSPGPHPGGPPRMF